MIMLKRNSHMKFNFRAQRGYAMLGIIALVGVAATALVVTSLSTTAVQNEQGRKTSSALALAKQALIASAASSNSRPGSLPCPDVDNDGQLTVNVDFAVTGACTSTVGRLPWQTLGLPDLRDASGERLWYAVSQQFTDATGNVVNISTSGQLNITGAVSVNNAIAIVFAPGAPISAQIRAGEHINSASHYIESYLNAVTYSASAAGVAYNDQMIFISAPDIFSVVERRIAKEVQNALKTYYTATSTLPWYSLGCSGGSGGAALACPTVNPLPTAPAVPTSLPATGTPGYIPTDNAVLALPAWFSANNWNLMMTYAVDSDCASAPGLGTCGTAFAGYTVNPSSGVLIGFSGGTANTGTKAVLSFAGVNTIFPNYQTTVLNSAMQLQ